MRGFVVGRRELGTAIAVILAVFPAACGSGSGKAPLDDANVLTSGQGGSSGNSGGSAGTGGGAPSDGDRFLQEYASAVCAMYEPCCNGAALGFDAAGCTDWLAKVTAAYLPDEFVPEAGAECLSALAQARAQDPDRCSNVALFDEASLRDQCANAFVASARDGAPLLGECLLAGDCASQIGDAVICYGRSCVRQLRGTSGDGPCYAGGNVGLAAEMYTCEAADGLYCNRGDNKCLPRVGADQRCDFGAACDDTSMCVGGTCRSLPEQGEACLNGIQGAGGYCRPPGACNTSTLICGAGPASGEACSEARACASGACIDNVCAASDWQRNLNCVGRASR